MKTLLLTLAYTIGIGELILAGYFWVTNSKNEIRQVMALLAFSTGMWVILSALIAYMQDALNALVVGRAVYVFGAFLVTTIVHLALVFPKQIIHIDRYFTWLLYLPATLLSIITLGTDAIISGTRVLEGYPGEPISGSVYPIYNLYLLVLFFLALLIFFKQRKQSDGQHRKNLTIVLSAFAIGGLPAVYLDLVTPFISDKPENFLLGNISTVIWLGAITYIIRKK